MTLDLDSKLAHTVTASTCPKCGQDCEIVEVWGRRFVTCDPCAKDEKEAEKTRKRQDEGWQKWRDITPPEFQLPLKREQLNAALAPALERPMQSMALIGQSYSGKTRIGYYLLRYAAEAGYSIFAVTHSQLRQAFSNRHKNDPAVSGKAEETIRAAMHAKCLLLDDLGKGAPTETGDEGLFEVLNHRYNKGATLITIWTSQQGSNWLKERFGADKGPAIVNRLAHIIGGKQNVFIAE